MNSVLNFYRHDARQEIKSRPFKVYTERTLEQIPAVARLSEARRFEMKVVASVLPFRVNEYIIDELIDWDQVPDDPIYQLTFPQREMLQPDAYERMAALHRRGAERAEIAALAQTLRQDLNPHPAGQMEMNRPMLDGRPLEGLQHKYKETVLFFPTQGQTCHAYCTFCFRWAQFVGDKELRIASSQSDDLLGYLRAHPEVTDLLVTGGDPMVMKTKYLAQYLEPLTAPEFDHIQSIRIGTKALTFWPHRFVSDGDSDELLMLLERLVKAGKHVALMAHYNHWREMETPVAREAIRRLRATGAEIRSQGPLLAHINDDAKVWARMWQNQVRMGIVPYYMFGERDTGARCYFEVPLARAWEIYRDAMSRVSGLARTARGPSMSAGPGKVEIQGVARIQGEKVFVLRFIQGRNPDWVQRPFFARYDEKATWLNHLKPAFGEEKFFFEDEYNAMKARAVTR
ncbi:KamA family radical SAM protein [Ectothiorhodospira lacustris]|uniref:KamA family radical SAM protein n=1 Tax=Ectothiorhodospira lacustris TaxID=2899127 RepID=UPI001EE7EA28|nr:lysine 2,3-aminomutase [Ectothiorhodospira lacustris]MCG5500522.1 lysine 2,3-aminomutase [Ectothiorhodospira lacustris]MCG5510164.1 lysine 2,3-aminomutase [Ectothiorhodospira lacustris]MCG5522007.1 lysine 2,3-aminomutase [Ectothiorhodospira lacustris]